MAISEKTFIISSENKDLRPLYAFFPTKINLTFLPEPLISETIFLVCLIIEPLNPPHNPLSAEQTINNTVLFPFVPDIKEGVGNSDLIFSVMELIILFIFSAYGRADTAFSCAFLSLAAATIFIAEVIFFVDFTLAILFLRSFKLVIISL